VELAAAIDKPADNIRGMFFDWTITGNWSWQGLVFSHGGNMLNAGESRVAFNEEPGQNAIAVLRKFVDAGRMGDIRPEVMFQNFFAGRMGISMQSTAQLGRYNREIGGRFPLKCARYPLSAARPRLPAGGNVAMVFTKNAAKQDAAWKFIKFACGPEGATMMVKATGYMPATSIPVTREDMLKGFYEQNPNHLVSIGQQDVITTITCKPLSTNPSRRRRHWRRWRRMWKHCCRNEPNHGAPAREVMGHETHPSHRYPPRRPRPPVVWPRPARAARRGHRRHQSPSRRCGTGDRDRRPHALGRACRLSQRPRRV